MKLTFVLLVLLLHIYFVIGDMWRNVYGHPDYPGTCLYRQTLLQLGESLALDDECVIIECKNRIEIEKQSCSPIELSPRKGCVIKEDLDKLYPECCPKYVCNEEISTEKNTDEDEKTNNSTKN